MRAFLTCAAACVSLATAPLQGADGQTTYTAEDVLAATTAWKNAFRSLRAEYRWSAPGTWKWRHPDLTLEQIATLYYRRCIWTYCDDGREKLETWRYQNGQLVAREIEGNDGYVHYLIRYVPGNRDPQRYRLWIPGPHDAPERIICPPVRHLYYGGGGHGWHCNRLRESPLDIVGTRQIADALCVGIRPSGNEREILWLDTTRDFLPRLLEPDDRFAVEVYRTLEDGHWFPARGTERVAPGTTPRVWRVESVTRNPVLSYASFALPSRPEARDAGASDEAEAEPTVLVLNPPEVQPSLTPTLAQLLWFCLGSGATFCVVGIARRYR